MKAGYLRPLNDNRYLRKHYKRGSYKMSLKESLKAYKSRQRLGQVARLASLYETCIRLEGHSAAEYRVPLEKFILKVGVRLIEAAARFDSE